MSEAEYNAERTQERPAPSAGRVLAIIIPVAIIAAAAYWWASGLESAARQEMSDNVFTRMLSANAAITDANMSYQDKDGDLVADPPEDPAKLIDPEVLVFSFVAGEEESVSEDAWKELLAGLREKSGR